MRLIEKECPNCGASLSFNENDKSCKCEYCKREFEIERDTDKAKVFVDQFKLQELKTPLKIFSMFTLGSFIVEFIIFIFAFIFIAFIGFSIFKSFNDKDNFFTDDTKVIEKVSQLKNSDYNTIDLYSNILIRKSHGGLSDFSLKGAPVREKVYLLTKGKKNKLIVVYRLTYENIVDKVTCTIFTAVEYKDVTRRHDSIAFGLDNGEIIAKEYYFNMDHSEYTYGYQESEVLYKELIEPLKDKYEIEEK